MHCDPARLCTTCLAEECARLREVAEALGDSFADHLATQLVPHATWIAGIDEHRPSVRQLFEGVAKDPALRNELSRMCAERARRRLLKMISR